MQISVSGKNMDTGAAFQTHAEDALNGVVNKYFDRAVSGHVTLEKADAGFRVKTRVALSRRIELEATGMRITRMLPWMLRSNMRKSGCAATSAG